MGENLFSIKPGLSQASGDTAWEPPISSPAPDLIAEPSPFASDSKLPTRPFENLEYELRYQRPKLFQPEPTPSTPSTTPAEVGAGTAMVKGIASGAAILFGLGLTLLAMGSGLAMAGVKEEKKPEERFDFPLTSEERLLVQAQTQKSPGDRALWDVAVKTGSRKEIDLILQHAKESEVLQFPGIASDLFVDLPSADTLPEKIADPGQSGDPLSAPSHILAGETMQAPSLISTTVLQVMSGQRDRNSSNRGAMGGVVQSHYFLDTNSAIISIDDSSAADFGWDDSDVMLWFDNAGKWIGFDLDLKDLAAELNRPPRHQQDLFTPENLAPFVLQSTGLHCEVKNNTLKVRFKKNLQEATSIRNGVILDIGKEGVSGFEFFFNRVPDMSQRLQHILF